jgi:hypothetical protein
MLYPRVNDGTWSASMTGKINGDGGHLMHRSGIRPNGQPYALTEDCCEPTAAVGKPDERMSGCCHCSLQSGRQPTVRARAESKMEPQITQNTQRAAVPYKARTMRLISRRRLPKLRDGEPRLA